MSKKKKHRKHKNHKKHNSPRNNQTNKTAVNVQTIETVIEEIETNVTPETTTEETVKSTTDTATVKTAITRKNIILYTVLITFAFILILFSSAMIFVNHVTRPVTVNTYTTPDFSRINNSFASAFCKLDVDVSSIDTSKVGDTYAPIKIFGFIKKTIKISVIDNISPKVVTRNLKISCNTEITPDLFIAEAADNSSITHTFVSCDFDTQVPGDYNINIQSTDEYGNSVTSHSILTVIDTSNTLSFEFGVSDTEIKQTIEQLFNNFSNINSPSFSGSGIFSVSGINSSDMFLVNVSIKDTLPPQAWVKSFDIALGQTLTQDDLISDISDTSKVSVTVNNMPDFKTPGDFTVEIILVDEFNNTSKYTSTIRIHDINTEIIIDEFLFDDDILSLIFKDDYSRSSLKFEGEELYYMFDEGENKFDLIGEFNKVTISVYIDDGSPPFIKLNNIKKVLNSPLSPRDFIARYYDATPLEFSFEEEIDTYSVGIYTVGIVATDKAGFSTVEYATLTVYEDDKSPKIYGVQDIYITVGDNSPNYLSGVTAFDNVDESVKVHVDSSAVDTSKEGTYTIIYKAVDSYGNFTEKRASVIVTKKVKVLLNVSNILQNPNLPNGCEVVSLSIVLNYLEYNVNPLFLYYDFMPKAELYYGNPMIEYVGDATGRGFGCYAPCVVTTGNDYIKSKNGSHTVYDVSGSHISDYKTYLDEGIPVIVWGLIKMNGNDKRVWDEDFNGEPVVWHSYSHCLVLVGYTEDTYIFCDPLVGITEYPKEDVEKSFDINFRQACIVK